MSFIHCPRLQNYSVGAPADQRCADESVSDPYPQRTIRIHIRIRTFLQIDIRIRYDSFSCILSTGMIEAN